MKNLKRTGMLAAFVLTLLTVSMALGQENKNRRGDGSSTPTKAAKNAAPSRTEAQLKDEQANSPSESSQEAARKAREERHRRNP
jgi:hypothetical protein